MKTEYTRVVTRINGPSFWGKRETRELTPEERKFFDEVFKEIGWSTGSRNRKK